MARNDLGELRRSAAVATFGPGAVVDFRADRATVSAVAAGLEEWDRNFPPSGMVNEQTIREERLEKKLNKRGFRLPPVRDPLKEKDEKALVAVRFPTWLQCPQCDRIGRQDMWADQPGRAGRFCPECTRRAPGRKEVYVVPVRFVIACEAGHLDEFPWHMWVDHDAACSNSKGFLKLVSEQAGLAGLILSCPTCQARKSMEGIFSTRETSRLPACRGLRPWLSGPAQTCTHRPRATQRGASNLYFPVIESALSIPPWSDRLKEAIGMAWELIVGVLPEDRPRQIEILSRTVLAPVLNELEMTPDQFRLEVDRRIAAEAAIDTENLRLEEYRQFTGGTYVRGIDREFEIRPQTVPEALKPLLSRLVKATRLREVRAMTGFTRIHPPGDSLAPVAQLSSSPLDWLPAIEVRGEGIFMELNNARLAKWENRPAVIARASRINERWIVEWKARHGSDQQPARLISARFLLIHTFAHALMRQLTLDCGYSSTALRERLYVETGPNAMAGLLIYTATTDDDGTLGGLQRQGDPERIERTVLAAIASQEWCSSDPLCIEDMLSREEDLSLAACHSCVLAPETSCEEFNRFLDRALLVGKPGAGETGYFSELLRSGPQ
ncbi:DUF1998 domain-containing protein [Bradyrhizobium brasilense]|uniref:DUF1998 domain-containing protein n=1 Tax=Bradyrhizobium brasilense TaxID=1419277 RepID=UPI0024B191CD|nr:DUF1998 domain-containing protein [Bradyrhizobium australafricanum]WFU31428.1 DUF1998 domain-containing protein [Bradyrhizobium australafricanum]